MYSKFLKKRNGKTKKEYQDYKKLFESIKKWSKKLHFSKLILKYKNNIRKTWQVIKEATGKEKYKQQILPKKILVDKISITETESIAESFNKYFTQIGPKLAKDIGTSTQSFNDYIKKHDTLQPEKVISVNELNDAFFSLKINKSAGYDDISFTVVKKCFGVLHKPLLHILNLSLQTGIFPDKLKIVGVTPLFKGGEKYELGNCRPISVLPCFSNEYIKKHYTLQPEKIISVNELNDAFFSLKINKSAGYDDISFTVVKKCFGVLHKPLLHILNLSLQTGIFPDKPKIAGVTPLFKRGENYELGN